MSQDYLTHISRDGERWDLLAFTYYGDANRFEPIMRANPDQIALTVLPGGLSLKVPILDEPATPPDAGMPPWLQ